MPSNFTLGFTANQTKSATQAPVMAGEAWDAVDQDPTGSWAPVVFPKAATPLPGRKRGVLCHLVTTTALRFAVSTSSPGSFVGSLVLANTERTFAIEAGETLYIKT